MPQIFYKIEELQLVDWETIIVYTCTSLNCLPEIEKDECYTEEFGYIQFSNDFQHVRFGEEHEIKAQKALKLKQLKELEDKEDEEIKASEEETKREIKEETKQKEKSKTEVKE